MECRPTEFSVGLRRKTVVRSMNRDGVESSNLRSVGYDANGKILEVEFHGGRIYRYFGVDEDTHASMMGSGSKGRFFQQSVRNRFSFERME